MTGTTQRKGTSLLLFYHREGAASWLAHLDTMRLFERSLGRASWPLSWTEDAFNPRPEIVFALPVGVGIETRRDPVQVTLTTDRGDFQAQEAVQALNDAFPPGFEVVDYCFCPPGGRSLMARVSAARYRIDAPGIGPAWQAVFLSGQPVLVEHLSKRKRTMIDLAPRLRSLDLLEEDSLILTAGAGSSDHLRIDLVLDALTRYGGLQPAAAQGARIIRLEVILDPEPGDQGIIV
ncbi:MAG: TIGR03936 family radical SAM-associated protein [Saccharofermentanales bacterium]